MNTSLARPVLLLLALFCLATAPPADQDYVNRDMGFELSVPSDWTHRELESSKNTLHLVLAPNDASDRVQLSVRVNPIASASDPDGLQAQIWGTIDGQPGYENARKLRVVVAGQEVPGLQVDTESNGVTYRVRQAYAAGNGAVFILQTVAVVDEFDQRLPSFVEVWNTFDFAQVTKERRAELALITMANQCGSEVDWVDSWPEAERRARERGRLILVSARMYPGFSISNETMSGPFMQPEIIELVNERYIPLRLDKGDPVPFQDQELYGMGPSTFGSAALIVTPDGEVLHEERVTQYAFLLEGLPLGPAAPPVEDPADPTNPVARAEAMLRRGDVEAARRHLAPVDTANAHRLLADIHRRFRQGDEALEQIRLARQSPGAEALEADLDIDEALLRMRIADTEGAARLLEGVLARHGDHARLPEVMYRMGEIERLLDGNNVAEVWWRSLIEDHADSRWAWQAAATLTSTVYAMDEGKRLDWPEATFWKELKAPRYETLPPDSADQAMLNALSYVLESQQADGSWITPASFGGLPSDPPDHFELAVTAICAQGLLSHLDDDAAAEAVERATDWLVAGYAEAVEKGEEAHFMDYTVWSRSYLLWYLADAVDAGVVRRARVAGMARGIMQDLADRQKEGGGWSYYLTGDLGSRDDPANQSISFCTAAAVMALLRAQQSGFDVEEGMLSQALSCLERMRNENGTYTYMLFHDAESAGRRSEEAGAAGRGPLCALALYLGQRGSLEEVRSSLDMFIEHRSGFSKETGKNLMHTGMHAQGSHYLMFDYANSAAAVAALPAAERGRYRDAILEELLRARTEEGAYVDNPINGRAYGAGMALQAYDSLR